MIHISILNSLTPNLYLDTVYDLEIEKLKKNGINTIITDLDNTLVGWNDPRPDAKLVRWFENLQEAGFKIAIVSNNSENRVAEFATQVDIPFISKANKPRRSPFKRAMELLQSTKAETAVIGDQIFTDVLGGNRTGLFTVLVIPINPKEFIGTKIVRQCEKIVLRHLAKKGRIPS
ncbi:YqeG family HAD IIIA-type phosphatase [Alkalicella caledoniensis]|uniref:YqeG family HAD IIIA-type phosphatase n=1 Tax=Alkalicella caledoniensis TaxID=2731377 RepID=UPI001FE34D20|nr:YqeG family HAD IIIA-type phosphatase [Alkalicella caledoniensis]